MLGRITLALIFLIVLSSPCPVQNPNNPVRLEDFMGSVSITPQWRFHVTDIKVGKRSVFHLFRDPNTDQTTWWKGGYFRQHPRPLMINSGADWEKLHDIVLDEGEETLQVSLADHHLTGWSRIPGLRSAIYEYECSIPLECERRTKLIYTELSKAIKHPDSREPILKEIRTEGETTFRLQVNDAFYKLLNNELKAFMKTLEAPKGGPCVDEIQLQKFLETEGMAGFGSGEYQLNEGLKNFLNVMIVVMRDQVKVWSQYHLDVKIVGHADRENVKGDINLLMSGTGIDEVIWRNTPSPLNVYFDRCNKNRLVNAGKPYYVDFASPAQGRLIEPITNNCELGAVRAYVAAAYLRSKLGSDFVSYSYATGGTKSQDKTDPEDRRIEIEFTMKGARKGK